MQSKESDSMFVTLKNIYHEVHSISTLKYLSGCNLRVRLMRGGLKPGVGVEFGPSVVIYMRRGEQKISEETCHTMHSVQMISYSEL